MSVSLRSLIRISKSSLFQSSTIRKISPIISSSFNSRNFSDGESTRLGVTKPKFFTKEDSRAFMAVWPDILRELTFEGHHTSVMPMINKHLLKSLQYNVPLGKKTRGLSVMVTYKHLTPPEQRTEEGLKNAIIMGWCVELLQAYFVVADDIMDQSETRRGQKCWYKNEDVGLSAFNDALIFESSIYRLLYNHFRDHPYYISCLHLFLNVNRRTVLGQSLDLTTSNNDITTFDMKRYSAIVKYKTSYYSLFLPVALGMRMCGYNDEEVIRQARTILLEIGHYFQVQDDYLDCFGDSEITGKIGTDIQDGKCSWLIVVAMQRANKAQKAELIECYGSMDPVKVKRVKEIYQELKVPKIFKTYEEEFYEDIQTHINQLSGGKENKKLPPQLFQTFVNKIYKRDR